MKIIKDEQRLINLHPLVVYFMLPPELYAEYGDNLKALNKYKGFTHGVFKFQAFSLSEEHGNALPVTMTDALKGYNMMVRLVDDDAGNFYYALHHVDFDTKLGAADAFDSNYNLVESSMHSFIVDVCKQNVEHLNERLAIKSATDSPSSRQNYTKMRDVFQYIALQQDFKHGVWERINIREFKYRCDLGEEARHLAEAEQQRRLEDSKFLRSIHHIQDKVSKAVDKLTRAGLSTYQAELAVETLWSIIETEFNIPDQETSDEIAKGTVDKEYSSYIRRDQTTRFKPQTEPTVSAAIKRVSVVSKNGHERLHWGVEFHVNGEAFPIYFGSKPQTMIYICTLLRAKLGEKLYLHEFFNNSKGTKSKFQRKKSMPWLEEVFYTIYPSMQPPFEEWMQKIQDEKNPGRPLNQGKSQAARKVQEALEGQPDGRYYCVIDTKSDSNGDSYYNIRIKPDNIMIPEKMQYLVDEFYDMMDIKSPKISLQDIKE